MSYCTLDSPTLIAHRGAPSTYPENTIASIKEAINVAMRYPELPYFIETDLRLSHDGEIMCVHDASLERIAGTPAFVSDLTKEELVTLPLKAHREIFKHTPQPPVGAEHSHFPITDSDMRIATLDEVMALVTKANEVREETGSPIGLACEVKPKPLSSNRVMHNMGRAVLTGLRSIGLGSISVNHLHDNPLVPKVADYINNQIDFTSSMPSLFFSTGTLGERDIAQLNQLVTSNAKAWMHQYDESRLLTTSAAETKALEGQSLIDKVQHYVASLYVPFTYIGSHLTPDQCPMQDNQEHNQPFHNASQLFHPINDEAQMHQAIEQKVDIIATDSPAKLAEIMQTHMREVIDAPDYAQKQVNREAGKEPLALANAPQQRISHAQHASQLIEASEPSIKHQH